MGECASRLLKHRRFQLELVDVDVHRSKPLCPPHFTLEHNQYSHLVISKYVTMTSGSLYLCMKIVDNLLVWCRPAIARGRHSEGPLWYRVRVRVGLGLG